ncbi:MAG: LysM peptidoglycan-binding domain-containing protein [Gemmatimonadota bacterium]
MLRTTIFRSEVTLVMLLVSAAGAVPAAVAQAAAKPTTYTIKAGDTLWSISANLLGDPFLWPQIYRLNTDVVEDPHWIYPGEVLNLVATPDTKAVPAQETPAPNMEPAPASKPKPDRPAVVPQVTMPDEGPQGPPTDSLFMRRRGMDARSALRTYRDQVYRPLRRGEFYSAGFLTENEPLSRGKVLGATTPLDIKATTEGPSIFLFSSIAIRPPEGAQYQANDTLLLFQEFDGPRDHGARLFPTGLARVTGQSGAETIATVIAVYSAIRGGQFVLPAEKFVQGGTTRAQPIASGVSGTVIGEQSVRELKQIQNFLFIDVGRKDGVAPGDIFEIRRRPGIRSEGASTIDELMGTLQVIRVRDHSATVKVLNLVSPDVPTGALVRQVAKLPS